jgi:uncharacterized membrane protein
MTDPALVRRGDDASANLALVNYGLLFASIFFAGVPALIAAIIAYSQRDEATVSVRSHFNFQIRIFWVAFGLSLAAGASALAAVVRAAGDLLAFGKAQGWSNFDMDLDMSRISIDGGVIALVVAFALFSVLAAAWLVAAPAIGFIRLASQRGMGHSAGS